MSAGTHLLRLHPSYDDRTVRVWGVWSLHGLVCREKGLDKTFFSRPTPIGGP